MIRHLGFVRIVGVVENLICHIGKSVVGNNERLVDEGPNNFFPTDDRQGGESDLAIAIFGLTLAAIIPAFIMYVQTMRRHKELVHESE